VCAAEVRVLGPAERFCQNISFETWKSSMLGALLLGKVDSRGGCACGNVDCDKHVNCVRAE